MFLFLTLAARRKAFFIVTVAYLITFAFGILAAYLAIQQEWSLLWTLFLADCVGTITGPLSISLLFHFISIPMIDRRMLARRANYKEIIERVPRWIPFFN